MGCGHICPFTVRAVIRFSGGRADKDSGNSVTQMTQITV